MYVLVPMGDSCFAFDALDCVLQDNVFMHHNKGGNPTAKVLGEYAGLIAEIRDRAGVKVHLFEHSHGECVANCRPHDS